MSSSEHSPETKPSDSGPEYQVLARKYRPQSFDDLLGHEAMVRTLRNAFEADRIAHAFILTGVRGVGKTTTARIMARALNYETDEVDKPTVDMPGEGRHCRAIAESRHPDVIEMDAASRTGVGDIRELIEGVRYAPTQGRYKVYIIDEVHMLSNSAFNALLKTLEEPPPHVKFIFATTEIRKVPVTVLSRCQRFDLRRFEAAQLAPYLGEIAKKEDASVEEDALLMIARAAEGSVRDSLSLLDQAIIQRGGEAVDAASVRDMLGLVDRTFSWDLLDAAMKGDPKTALDLFGEQYNAGADPGQVMRDLLDITHLLTRTKAAGPEAASHGAAGEADAARAKAMAAAVPLPALTRVWSLLMKALEEVMAAPDPAAAAEIGLIRIAYTAGLPTPEEAVKALKDGGGAGPQGGAPGPGGGGGVQASGVSHAPIGGMDPNVPPPGPTMALVEGRGSAAPSMVPAPVPAKAPPAAGRVITCLQDIAEMAGERRDAILRTRIETCIRPVTVEEGRLDIALTKDAPSELPGALTKSLKAWTGIHWVVSVVPDPGGIPTLRETRDKAIQSDPMIKALFETFPNAKINSIRPLKDKKDD